MSGEKDLEQLKKEAAAKAKAAALAKSKAQEAQSQIPGYRRCVAKRKLLLSQRRKPPH